MTLRLSHEGDCCTASVSDTGPGIPKELREKIFTLGFTTRPANGKGFGLSFVKNYVLLLGGTIRADNLPDSGACFSIVLPSSGVARWSLRPTYLL